MSTQRAAELAVVLGRHYPNATAERIGILVIAMQKAAQLAQRWEAKMLNEHMPSPVIERGNQHIERAETQINLELIALGRDDAFPAAISSVWLGGDARGNCGELRVPGLLGDGVGGGFPIY